MEPILASIKYINMKNSKFHLLLLLIFFLSSSGCEKAEIKEDKLLDEKKALLIGEWHLKIMSSYGHGESIIIAVDTTDLGETLVFEGNSYSQIRKDYKRSCFYDLENIKGTGWEDAFGKENLFLSFFCKSRDQSTTYGIDKLSTDTLIMRTTTVSGGQKYTYVNR